MAARRPATAAARCCGGGGGGISHWLRDVSGAGRWTTRSAGSAQPLARRAAPVGARSRAAASHAAHLGRPAWGPAARYSSSAASSAPPSSADEKKPPPSPAVLAERAAAVAHLEPLRLRYLTVDQLEAVFGALVAKAGSPADGDTPAGFGLAGVEALLRDLAAARAATETPSALAAAQRDDLPVSAAEVLSALDANGDGLVSWEDFDAVIGKASEKVDSRVYTVAGSLMFNFTAQGAAMPTIPLIAREIGCSTADIGFITSASALSRLVCNMPCAWLAEKVGRRPLLIAGPVIGAASITMFGMSHSYEALIGWNAVFGIGSATTAAASTLYLNDVATPRNRSRTTAPTTITALLGFAIGPAMAGLMGEKYGLSAPFFLCGAGMSVAAASALIFLPETRRLPGTTHDPAVPIISVLPSDKEAGASDAASTADSAKKDQAVWQQWGRLLRVPNLQAVYVAAFATGGTHGS